MNNEEFIKYCDQAIEKYSNKEIGVERWVRFHSQEWYDMVENGWVTKENIDKGKLCLMIKIK